MAPGEKTPLNPKTETTDKTGQPFWAASLGSTATLGLSVLAQMSFGVGMSITNKSLTNVMDLPLFETIIQMIVTIIVLCTAFYSQQRFGSWRDTQRWIMGPPVLYGLQLASSMIGTAKLTLAQQISIRNAAPFITLPIERFFTEKVSVSHNMLLGMLTIAVGVSLFFLQSQTPPDPWGVIWIVANMGLAMTARLLERRFLAIEKLDLSVSSGLLLNNIVGLLPVTATMFIQGEHKKLNMLSDCSAYQLHHKDAASGCEGSYWAFWGLLALSCVLAIGIGWTGLMLQKQVTATTMLVIINMNKFIVVLYGMTALREDHGVSVIFGCLIALFGGCWFGYAGLRLKQRLEREKKAAEEKKSLEGEPAATGMSWVCNELDKDLC